MKKIFKRSMIFVLMFFICFNALGLIKVKAADEKTTIMIDLDKGNISLTSSCSGYVTNYDQLSDDIKSKFTAKANGLYTWTHSTSYSYYIYQSGNGLDNKNIFNEAKNAVSDFKEVAEFGDKWDYIATQKGMKAANGAVQYNSRNRISVGGAINIEIILHNVWATYYTTGNSIGSIEVTGASNGTYTFKLRGDNRLSRLGYTSSTAGKTKLIICDDPDEDYEGTLTVIGDQDLVETCSVAAKNGKYPANHWDSAIGGNDSAQDVYGLTIESGIVYAGTTADENCTAIGGGGNGYGQVSILGGTVYAIASTTGTAIGGGIGHMSYGGDCEVNISGGTVYAYNFGQPFVETAASTSLPKFVPGTAIGGGSSIDNCGNRNNATVNITGGYVEAYSVAGSAIGGGNSINMYGGKGVVSITGGEVTATSVESTKYNMPKGTGIGGGSSSGKNSGARNGGEATVTITNGIVNATGIGGGTSTHGDGGHASVTVKGGTLDSLSIGGGFSEANGYAYGDVTVLGGSMNSEVSTIVYGVDDKSVYLTRVQLYKDDIIQKNTLVQYLGFEGITDSYGLEGIYTDEEGYVYIWIPEGSAILSGKIDENEYLPVEEVDGKINVTDLGILKYESPIEHCHINIVNSMYYIPSLSTSLDDQINGFIIIEKNILFKYYLIADSDSYTITPYHAVTTSSGMIYQMGNQLTKVEGMPSVYESTEMTIASDTQIIFNIRDSLGNSYYTLDLTNGDINVTEGDNNTIVIEQGGYILNVSKDDKLYLTSAGYPTDNSINFNLSEGTEIDVYMDKMNASSDEHVINVQSGTVNLEFSSSDNMITSSGDAPIMIGENGRLNISSSSADKNSIKLESATGHSAIAGQGTLAIMDNGGYLKFNSLSGNTSVPQISVGTYIYKGTEKPSYTANIYGGEFTFDVIGYLDSSGNLKSKDELGNDNINDFTARGIFRVFTDVKSASEAITNGNFVMTLQGINGSSTIGDIVIKQGSNTLNKDTDYIVSDSNGQKIITIYGNSFKEGSLTIMAAGYGKIAYVSDDYEGVYDGNAHNIVLIFDDEKFIAYYSDKQLNKDNYLSAEDNTKEQFARTDFTNGKVTVYWYIVPIDSSIKYEHASGSNTINILQATNKWTIDLTCPDIALNYNINPKAEAKFGEHKYEIYTVPGTPATEGVDYNLVDSKYYFIKEGTYYIKAIVDGNSNYTGLDSGYIRFKVVEIAIFTDVIRNLTSVNGSNNVIGVTSNGAFSVRYEFLSIADMQFMFTTSSGSPVPKGTQFTLIVFDDVTTKYYYYNYDPIAEAEGTLNIKLVEFQLMGTKDGTNKFAEPNTGSSANYQITVDFPDNLATSNSNELTVKLNAVEGNVIVKRDSNTDAVFDEDLVVSTDEDSITADVEITSNPGSGETILAFSIYKDDNPCDLDYSNISLTSGNNLYFPSVYGNVIFFSIGKSTQTNVSYSLIIEGLQEGDYNIVSDVRVIFTSDVQHSLGNTNDSNHKSKDIEVLGDKYTAVHIEYTTDTNNVLIVEEPKQEVNFKVYLSDKNFDAVVNYNDIKAVFEIYENTPNGYIRLDGQETTLQTNELVISWPVSPSNGQRIYQLRITIDNEIAYYNFIVASR